jgi:hypothetical protein
MNILFVLSLSTEQDMNRQVSDQCQQHSLENINYNNSWVRHTNVPSNVNIYILAGVHDGDPV